MEKEVKSIPRPLVRTYQWSIVISVLLTWFTGQEWILAIPLSAGLSGLLFNYNFIMEIAKMFLKNDKSIYIPEDVEQQRFNSIISVVCLVGGLLGYIFHYEMVAYFLTAMVAIAAFVAILGFCIGCFLRLQWQQYKYNKT
ncbi:MAG: DUF4395 domain-containing protein [Bacillota bacterium]